jgi:tagaturonate reductase
MVPISFLNGNDTVAESMQDSVMSAFIRHVMLQEIVPSLDMPHDEAEMFAHQVLDRFANPFVHHELMSIALQQTTKLDVRVVPSLYDYHNRTGRLPQGIVLAFAANLLFVTREGRASEVELPMDDRGSAIRAYRKKAGRDDMDGFVRAVCTDREVWHAALDALPGFIENVASRMREMQRIGTRKTLEAFLSQTSSQKP